MVYSAIRFDIIQKLGDLVQMRLTQLRGYQKLPFVEFRLGVNLNELELVPHSRSPQANGTRRKRNGIAHRLDMKTASLRHRTTI
jgi:hypothetical protein